MHGSCFYRCDKMQRNSEESVEKWCMMATHIVTGQFRGKSKKDFRPESRNVGTIMF